MSAVVCGDHTVEAYSNCGQMMVLNAVDFSVFFVCFDIPLKESECLISFFGNIVFVSPQPRSSDIMTHRDLATDTPSISIL